MFSVGTQGSLRKGPAACGAADWQTGAVWYDPLSSASGGTAPLLSSSPPPRVHIRAPRAPLSRSVCLDCIVTVVDARHIRRQLADPRPDGAVNEAQQQVAFADVVLLNKVRCRGGWHAR